MMEFLDILQSPWAIRALIASSLVGIMCGALGAFIVLRNMSLIGDALAHAILPGIVIAFILFGHHSLGFFAGAVVAGLLTAAAITWIQNRVRTKNDAAIGIVFTTMFALGVIGISRLSKNEGVHLDLKDFLFGNVLGVSDTDLQLTTAITVVVLGCIAIFFRQLFSSTFQPVVAAVMGVKVSTIHYLLMLLLSFAVVAALRTVGVILVVAMLITPAATALLLSSRLRHVIAIGAILGLVSSVLGLLLSIVWEIAPGPAMAVTVTFFYILAVFFSPSKGLLFKYLRHRAQQVKINVEDLLKQGFHLQVNKKLSLNALTEKLGWPASKVQSYGQRLRQKGLAKIENGIPVMTETGIEEANKLIRAHRLWESYLVRDLGLTEEQIHEDAERYEHLLTEDLLQEMDQHLGYPDTDPHGAPIPEQSSKLKKVLVDVAAGTEVDISSRQLNTHVTNELWKMGLTPGEPIKVARFEDGKLCIRTSDDQDIYIDRSMAAQIYIVEHDEEKV